MIFIAFGKWSASAGRFFTMQRFYYRGHWTPFVKVGIRYLCLG